MLQQAMDSGDSDISDAGHFAACVLSGQRCFLGDGQIGSPGTHDDDVGLFFWRKFAWFFAFNNDEPCKFVIDGLRDNLPDRFVMGFVCFCRQDSHARLGHRINDFSHLLRCFVGAKDGFWETAPDKAMVVNFRKAQFLKGQMPNFTQSIINAHLTLLDFFQNLPKPLDEHQNHPPKFASTFDLASKPLARKNGGAVKQILAKG
jgi:hypothetical protein